LHCTGAREVQTIRDEHKQRVGENRVLRKTFGPEEKEVTGDWRKLDG
jgi:hypothetical protein